MTTPTATRIIEMLSAASDIPAADISPESRLDELGFDSLVIVEMSLKLKKEFGLMVTDDALERLDTVDEMIALVDQRQPA